MELDGLTLAEGETEAEGLMLGLIELEGDDEAEGETPTGV